MTIVAALLGVVAPVANAAIPEVVAAHAQDVTEFLYRGGGTNTFPSCGSVCSDLWLAEHRPIPGQPTSTALWSELTELRSAAGVLPEIGSFGLGSTLVAGAASFTVGWKIGTAIRGIFVHGDVPPAPSTPATVQDYELQHFNRGNTYGSVTITQPGYYVGAHLSNNTWTYEFTTIETAGPECPWLVPAQYRPPFGSPAYSTGSFGCDVQNGQQLSTPDYMWRQQVITGPATDITGNEAPDQMFTSGTIGDPGAAMVQRNMLNELNAHPEQYPTLIPWLDNHLGGNSDDPSNPAISVSGSTCAGLSGSACADALRAAGFGGVEVVTLDGAHSAPALAAGQVVALDAQPWATVVPQFTDVEIADPLERPVLPYATYVAKPLPLSLTLPEPARILHAQDTIVVIENPDVLPRVVPAPLPRETFEDFASRVTTRALVPQRQNLADALIDPARGPGEAVRTQPHAGSRVAVGSDVVVLTNPDAVPAPGGTGACSIPAVRPFDLGPLNVPVGDKFPFGAFGWLFGALGGWSSAGQAPSFAIPFVHGQLEVDFAEFEPAMALVRPIVATLAFLSLAWLLAASALGIGATNGED